MTLEHRLIVGLEDIKAVTLECKKCGARLSTSPDEVQDYTLYKCGACMHPWLSDSTKHAHLRTATLAVFIGSLSGARATVPEDAVGVRVLLEFDIPRTA